MTEKETSDQAADKVAKELERIRDSTKKPKTLPCISCKKDIPADSIWCPYCKIQQGR